MTVPIALFVVAAAWEPLGPAPIATGPYTGRVSSVAPSATDPDVLYVAGASGGVWRRGADETWEALTDDLPTTAIGAVAVDPFDDEVVYAGSGEANYAFHSFAGAGLYKSEDGGMTWSIFGADAFAGRTFARIVVSPADTQVVFAATMRAGGFPATSSAKGHPQADGPVGVWRSSDGGESWAQLAGGLPAVPASDVALDPSDPDRLYAAIGDPFGDPSNGIYVSSDGGDNWTQLAGGLPASGIGRISLAVAPTDAARLYALITRPMGPTGGGATTINAYRSDDAGASWAPTGLGEGLTGGIGWYVNVTSVSPTDPDTAFFGGVAMARTLNAGTSFADVTPPHVDVQALAWDAADRLVVGDDGGVHRTADGGSGWTALNDGLAIVQFYPGVSRDADASFMIGGTQDNGTNILEDDVWRGVIGADGGPTARHRDAPAVLLAQFQGTGNLFRSVNGGASFAEAGTTIGENDRTAFFSPVLFHPDEPSVAFLGTQRVYGSEDGGQTWTGLSGDLTGGTPAAIRALAMNSSALWAVTNEGRVLRSDDLGATFELTFDEAIAWARTTTEIAADPEQSDVAVLVRSQFGVDQVMLTLDRGATWTSIDGDLPDLPANSVAISNSGAARRVVVGTDAGVYATCDDGATWSLAGEGLPNAPVHDVSVEGDTVLAATMGRGAFRTSVPECPGPEDDTGETTADPGPETSDTPDTTTDRPPDATTVPPGTSGSPAETSGAPGSTSESGCGCGTGSAPPALLLPLCLFALRRRLSFSPNLRL